MGRYFAEKGLKSTDDFDVDDWMKWQERKVVYDARTPEQRKDDEQKEVLPLGEVANLTDEEADKLGVRHIKNMYYRHKLEEMKDEEFINGETIDGIMNQ